MSSSEDIANSFHTSHYDSRHLIVGYELHNTRVSLKSINIEKLVNYILFYNNKLNILLSKE